MREKPSNQWLWRKTRDDPWAGKEKSRIFALCEERQIPCAMIPRGNHSLESKDVFFDMEQLPVIMRKTEKFLWGEV